MMERAKELQRMLPKIREMVGSWSGRRTKTALSAELTAYELGPRDDPTGRGGLGLLGLLAPETQGGFGEAVSYLKLCSFPSLKWVTP